MYLVNWMLPPMIHTLNVQAEDSEQNSHIHHLPIRAGHIYEGEHTARHQCMPRWTGTRM